MSGGEVLAQLLAQGAERGADLVTLRAIAEEAGELGATRALTRLGLADAGAPADVAELRELLQAWRDAKRSAWKAAVACATRSIAASTAALVASVKGGAPGCVTHLLIYLPTVLDAAAPEARRANLPVG